VANWSNVDVSRSVRTHLCRVLLRTLAAASCLLWGTQACHAAGCHVLDRPVLQSGLSWEHDRAFDLNERPVALAPPVLAHPPCQGETPHVLDSSIFPVDLALLDRIGVDPPGRCDPLAMHSPREHLQPPPLRLVRPPRLLEIGVTIELAA